MGENPEIKRYKLGILFNFSPQWMGGIVYIINLIKTLDFLDDEEKPEIILFYRVDLRKYISEINYPYLYSVEWKFPTVYRAYIKSWLLRKNFFVDKILERWDLDGLYPIHDFPVKSKTRTKLVSWYADLQHKYYPDFFSWKTIIERNTRMQIMLLNSNELVVSSQAVANDFSRFFKIHESLRISIFQFVSVIDGYGDLNILELRKKYNLPEKYFMISNQFHRHKNHKVLLEAIVCLKEKDSDIYLAMTGRFPEASHSTYMYELHYIIKNRNIQSQINLMGIVPRNEQLLLMRYSQAVVQPSLFEGWSTVIEDAKSLQVPVIASNIPVNIEQLGPAGNYFEPHDKEKLAEMLCNFPSRNLNDIFYEDYEERVRKAATVFINIFQ